VLRGIGLSLLLLVLVVALAACTGAATPRPQGPEEVQVTATEFKFQSSKTTFSVGVPYRFVVKNAGQIPHEWMIMPAGEKEHVMALLEVEEDELPAGATVAKEFTFSKAGDYEFGCYLPGHYEAGMWLRVTAK
jgi:uncharacterized cupredoxin-like copper-binding protein